MGRWGFPIEVFARTIGNARKNIARTCTNTTTTKRGRGRPVDGDVAGLAVELGGAGDRAARGELAELIEPVKDRAVLAHVESGHVLGVLGLVLGPDLLEELHVVIRVVLRHVLKGGLVGPLREAIDRVGGKQVHRQRRWGHVDEARGMCPTRITPQSTEWAACEATNALGIRTGCPSPKGSVTGLLDAAYGVRCTVYGKIYRGQRQDVPSPGCNQGPRSGGSW